MKTKTTTTARLLSQIELATLAANLPTGNAKERVRLAFEIWQEADPVKTERAFYLEKLSAIEDKHEKDSIMIDQILEAEAKKAVRKERASKGGKALWYKKRAGTSSERKAGGKTQQVKKRAKG